MLYLNHNAITSNGVKNMDKIALTAKETAEMLNISLTTIYTMARQNEIPHKRVRGRVLFYKPALEKWLSDGGFVEGEV